MGLVGRAWSATRRVYTAAVTAPSVLSRTPGGRKVLPAHAGCRSGNTLAGQMRMIRASAGAAELGSVRPLASACGPGVAVEPTPLPARRGSSRCCRSRPRAHEAPARASALRRPAPPRCYRPDMALETRPFPSDGSRRTRRPLRTDNGTAPRKAVSQGFCASEDGLARGVGFEWLFPMQVAWAQGCDSMPHHEGHGQRCGLPIKPIHVRYHQTHQGISDTSELPIITRYRTRR